MNLWLILVGSGPASGRNAALKAIVGAHIIVAAIILARSDGWLQPFELLIYDALRVAWAGHTPARGYFWWAARRTTSPTLIGR
jgi:hypothetical protein